MRLRYYKIFKKIRKTAPPIGDAHQTLSRINFFKVLTQYEEGENLVLVLQIQLSRNHKKCTIVVPPLHQKLNNSILYYELTKSEFLGKFEH